MDDRSRSGPASDFFVHLNCLSDAELYSNKSSCFTNDMNPPILLPFHTPYEVALSNIYFKQEFYKLLANEEESSIQFVYYVLKIKPSDEESADRNKKDASENIDIIDLKLLDSKPSIEKLAYSVIKDASDNIEVIDKKILHKIYPSTNLIGDTKSIINNYNKQLNHQLMEYDELNMKIHYNITAFLDFLVTKNKWFKLDLDDNKYGALAIKFGRKIANIFGYYSNMPYFVRCETNKIDIKSLNALVTKPSHSFEREIPNPISNIFVYTNIVKRSQTGSKTTNLLEVVP